MEDCVDTINLSISFGKLAKSLKEQDIESIKYNLCEIIDFLDSISIKFDINFVIAFDKWKKKALSKKYF
tara:strand:- start:220 stop:426 length:207 start_codon:yes stop_codon:yes gene_type:complete